MRDICDHKKGILSPYFSAMASEMIGMKWVLILFQPWIHHSFQLCDIMDIV